jgi:hypothetical protein
MRDPMKKIEMVHYWQGRPVSELTHEELLAAFIELADIAGKAREQANAAQRSAVDMMKLAASQIRQH